MRRDSQLLADEGDSIHQMSELGHGYSSSNAAPIAAAGAAMGAGAGAYALHRGNSTANSQGGASLPGLQRNDTMNPRPPTMIQRHYAGQAYAQQQQQQQQMHQMHQQQMPSFQPGQIVYPNMSSNQSGPYPTFQPSPGNVQVGGVFPASTGGDLNRNQSYREQQQQQYPSNAVVGNDYGGYGTSQDGHNNNNGYGSQQDHLNNDNVPQRSGTPEYANPQQYFHQASDSFSSSAGIGGGGGVQSPFDDGNASPARNYGHPLNSNQQQQCTGYNNNTGYNGNGNEGMETLYPQQQQQSHGRDGNVRVAERAKRTLSVRNGGAVLDDDAPRDSVYGGM